MTDFIARPPREFALEPPDAALRVERRWLRAHLSQSLFGASRAPAATVAGYEVVRRLGGGAMGLVFEVRDPRTDRHLALKVLRRTTAVASSQLKREFRSLARMHHPNIIRFYDLFVDASEPCITMELLHGSAVLDYLWPEAQLSVNRLLRVARQLVDAVSALHEAKVLHRDLKPSNLRVESDGRLVVLDMGLAITLDDAPPNDRTSSGTPLYMAPERMQSDACSEASDWYSVGVVLFEALGGVGSRDARTGLLDIEAARRWLAGYEGEASALAGLSARMLDPRPERRPQALELRTRLGLNDAPARLLSLEPRSTGATWVGRDRELQQLHQAFAQAKSGAATVVHITGEPGIGKTALAKHFAAWLERTENVLVLASRCHEREFVPYNAFDGVVDALHHELLSVAHNERAQLCGDGRAELLRLFPALAPVLGESVGPADSPHTGRELQELRRRGFRALRGVLTGLSRRRPLVLLLDDLQWSDEDSAQLLSALFEGGGVPAALLLLACYRRGDAEQNASVRALRDAETNAGSGAVVIELGGLSEVEARCLAAGLIDAAPDSTELAPFIDEAAGNPLFLRLLVQDSDGRDGHGASIGTLRALLLQLVQRLPEPSRSLLELAAVAGCPVDRQLLLTATAAHDTTLEWEECVAVLQRSRVIRSIRRAGVDALDTYHDRIRETLTDALSDDRRRSHHAALACAARLAARPDHEFLARHCEGALEFELAAEHAERAGDVAFDAVALVRAAELYRVALRCLRGERPVALLQKLAESVAHAGRCAEAGPLYLEAANRSEFDNALRLRLLAAEMFLRCGAVRECKEVVRPVLKAVGVRFPSSPRAALLSASIKRVWLSWKLRGRNLLAPRAPGNALDHLRSDVCFTLGYRLGTTDAALAASLLMSSLSQALHNGTDGQLARALASYALALSTIDSESREPERLFAASTQLAERAVDHDARGWVALLRAVSESRTEFRAALILARDASDFIAAHCKDTAWRLQEVEWGSCSQLFLCGEAAELGLLLPPALMRTEQNGDRFAAARLKTVRPFVWLAADQPHDALAELDELLSHWGDVDPFQVAAIAVVVKIMALLYTRDAPRADRTFAAFERRYRAAGYLRIEPWATLLLWLRASIALAGAQRASAGQTVREVERCLARLRRQRSRWALATRTLVEAGLARLQRDDARAATLYETAAAQFDAQALNGFANAAVMRAAELRGSASDEPRLVRAREWLCANEITRASAWTQMYAP